MKKVSILLILILAGATLPAQIADAGRMQRDIEVAENIIATLFGENKTAPYPGLGPSSDVEGSYIEGFGVLFTIAPRYLVRGFRIDESGVVRGHVRSDVVVIPDGQGPEGRRERRAATPAGDSLDAGARFRKVVETFASDYAYLLRQLPPTEKLMIRYGSNTGQEVRWRVVGTDGTTAGEPIRSAVISKADIDAYQSGRLQREQFLTRISFTTESGEAGERDRDLLLLSGIFARLYASDLSETFSLKGSVPFDRIEGLGAVFHLTLAPRPLPGSVYFSDGLRLRPRERSGVVMPMPEKAEPAAEEIIELENAYPAFLDELKANIIEYGSIVKNLAPGEALVFRIRFISCGECKTIPESIEITCPKAALDSYRQQKMSLETAMKELRVKTEEQKN